MFAVEFSAQERRDIVAVPRNISLTNCNVRVKFHLLLFLFNPPACPAHLYTSSATKRF